MLHCGPYCCLYRILKFRGPLARSLSFCQIWKVTFEGDCLCTVYDEIMIYYVLHLNQQNREINMLPETCNFSGNLLLLLIWINISTPLLLFTYVYRKNRAIEALFFSLSLLLPKCVLELWQSAPWLGPFFHDLCGRQEILKPTNCLFRQIYIDILQTQN